ncbi:MAG: hypothetical protein AB1630_10950 [bacterium]
MEVMIKKSVIPFLKEKCGANQAIIKSKILRTYGISESKLELEIKDLLKNQNNPTIAL